MDLILVRRAVESELQPRVALPVHLPGDLVAWKASEGTGLVPESRGQGLGHRVLSEDLSNGRELSRAH